MKRNRKELSRLSSPRHEFQSMSSQSDSVVELRPFAREGYRVLSSVNMDAPQDKGWSIADLLSIVQRRKWMIAASAAVLVSAGTAFSFLATPLYTAEGLLLLATPKAQITDVKAVIAGPPLEAATVRSEIEILKAPAMAEKVTDALKLWEEPVYRGEPKQTFLEWIGLPPITMADALEWLGWSGEADDAGEDEQASPQKMIASALSTNLDVVFDGRSYVVRLRFSSPDGGLAARIVNTFMEIGVAEQLTNKSEAARRAKAWLQARLAELHEQVARADQAAETYRAAHRLTESRGVTLIAQQLSELNSQLVVATAERAHKEAGLHQLQTLRKSPDGFSTAGQVLASPIVQRLSDLETDVDRRLAEASVIYLDHHPRVTRLRSERTEVQRKLAAEIGKVIKNLTDEVTIARVREDDLRSRLAAVQKEHNQLGEAEIRLRELQRHADVSRRIYETFLTRELEIRGQEEIEQADARIVSYARPPLRPAYPRKGVFIGLSLAAGLAIGLFLAFVAETLDRRFRKATDLETEAGLQPLGIVPAVRRPDKTFMQMVEQPRSAFSEAVRSIRTALSMNEGEGPPKVILVTSSVSAEGKSLIAASLARSAAQAGVRSLLVDCDLRRPAVSRLLRDRPRVGMVELLREQCAVSEALRHDDTTGMKYIACSDRLTVGSPQDLLGSPAMQRFITEARFNYDLIILDAPPVLAVSDAIILSRFADAMMLVVRWRHTRHDTVRAAVDALRISSCPLVGAVLSRVDIRKQVKSGWREAAFYHRAHALYYR